MKLDIINIKGEKIGRSAELNDEVFAVEPNDHVIYLDVKRYLNSKRQGSHKSKQRNEIAGSTKKLRKQKGGGGARIGGIKSPLLRGGGRIFGPQPRDYDIKLNKKEKLIAKRSALSYKAKDNAIMVLEGFSFDEPKTKNYIAVLNALSVGDKKTLLVLNSIENNIIKSVRNLPNAAVTTAKDLNTYAIMNAGAVIMVEEATNFLNDTLK